MGRWEGISPWAALPFRSISEFLFCACHSTGDLPALSHSRDAAEGVHGFLLANCPSTDCDFLICLH